LDSSGYVSFAGTNYRVGNGWRGRSAEVCIVAGSVPLSCDGHILRVHPIRHHRAKEHGSGAEPPTSRATKMIMSRRYRNSFVKRVQGGAAPARPGQGLFDVANQLGQPIRSLLVALVGQTLQLLEVATLCGQLGQPIRSLLISIIGQPTQH
jgi:hypothetical protein